MFLHFDFDVEISRPTILRARRLTMPAKPQPRTTLDASGYRKSNLLRLFSPTFTRTNLTRILNDSAITATSSAILSDLLMEWPNPLDPCESTATVTRGTNSNSICGFRTAPFTTRTAVQHINFKLFVDSVEGILKTHQMLYEEVGTTTRALA
jgi:hypothetical protein